MAIRYECDGCGAPIPEGAEPRRVGRFVKRDYCEACEALANEYTAALDELHDKQAKAFQKARDTLLRTHGKKLARLPDHGGR